MEKLRAILFNKSQSPASSPEYDKPFLTRRYGNIRIPPKPAHLCGKSIAPKCARPGSTAPTNKENTPVLNNFCLLEDENNADVSRVLFGEPIAELVEQQETVKNPRMAPPSRYPTVALFGSAGNR